MTSTTQTYKAQDRMSHLNGQGSLAFRNDRHLNDLIKAPRPFMTTIDDADSLIIGLGPAPGVIYTPLMQRKHVHYFFSLKPLLHTLTNLSIGVPTVTTPSAHRS
jgi:hypothetical protein